MFLLVLRGHFPFSFLMHFSLFSQLLGLRHWNFLPACSAFSTALPPVLDPAQQQRGAYRPGCRRGKHPRSPRGDSWNRWLMTQRLFSSPKKLLLHQQDHFTEALTECLSQSSDLSPRGSREWGVGCVRWIHGFWGIHSEAWSRAGGRSRIIPAPSPLVVYSAQWLRLGEAFVTVTWFGAWSGTRGESELFWQSLWTESTWNQSCG